VDAFIDASTRADVARSLGVLVAVVGAFVVAPEGRRALVDDVKGRARRAWHGLRRSLPWRRNLVLPDRVGSSRVASWAVATGTATGRAWPSGVSTETLINVLHEHVEALYAEVHEVRAELRTEREERRTSYDDLAASMRETTERLAEDLERF
jgi:hypothetical protein